MQWLVRGEVLIELSDPIAEELGAGFECGITGRPGRRCEAYVCVFLPINALCDVLWVQGERRTNSGLVL